mgnify:CR=1 FL=1
MSPSLHALFDRYALVALDRQLRLEELVGELDWTFNLQSGLLSFGDRFCWRAEVLGTESDATQTWLWAWANQASNIPSELLEAVSAVRGWGFVHKIPELLEPKLPLGEINGHCLAMIGSGIWRANAYYRAPYDAGAAFLLIKDSNFPRNDDSPSARLATVFPQAISAISINNHRSALQGYLEAHMLKGQEEGDRLVVLENGQPLMSATFDEHDRLVRLEATLKRQAMP